ncbi:MAG: hypothetical protein M0R80_01510 [Proteobacteria bacterium]|jgi:hypothetical protein|nr:hypothetical protein [Pseudomonadota bacterium]
MSGIAKITVYLIVLIPATPIGLLLYIGLVKLFEPHNAFLCLLCAFGAAFVASILVLYSIIGVMVLLALRKKKQTNE